MHCTMCAKDIAYPTLTLEGRDHLNDNEPSVLHMCPYCAKIILDMMEDLAVAVREHALDTSKFKKDFSSVRVTRTVGKLQWAWFYCGILLFLANVLGGVLMALQGNLMVLLNIAALLLLGHSLDKQWKYIKGR